MVGGLFSFNWFKYVVLKLNLRTTYFDLSTLLATCTIIDLNWNTDDDISSRRTLRRLQFMHIKMREWKIQSILCVPNKQSSLRQPGSWRFRRQTFEKQSKVCKLCKLLWCRVDSGGSDAGTDSVAYPGVTDPCPDIGHRENQGHAHSLLHTSRSWIGHF